MQQFVKKTYSVAPEDDVKLAQMAKLSGTGSKSAELRTLIRREYKRVLGNLGFAAVAPENEEEGDE